MRRIRIIPRENYQNKLEIQGLSFHSWDNYWKEDACYEFSLAQIEMIESATEELHQMYMFALQKVIDQERFSQLSIPKEYWEPIANSFKKRDFSIYSRFDFAFDGFNPPKMFEYNADTPTSLLESAVCQWYWLEDCYPQHDQFNSIHERLVEKWKSLPNKNIHVTSLKDNEEDWVCAMYIIETLTQAGKNVVHSYIEDIGFDKKNNEFVDIKNRAIEAIFKLYPWEWIMREPFGEKIKFSNSVFIEPLYKAALSCKGMLPILWELFPDHPNLLPAFFDSSQLTDYAKKPLYSREGADIELVKDKKSIFKNGSGVYGSEGFIYQKLHSLPCFDGQYPVIGSWLVDDKSAGMCIREDKTPITTNMSHFIPHYFHN